MKIFISHSSKDCSIAKALSSFLEGIDPSVNVFCSSQIGNIKAGRDFVDVITDELNECTAFIPLISSNYYTSRFCMIELGFAYSILSNKIEDGCEYIYPLSVPPIKKSEALVDTPLARLQVTAINDVNEIKSYLESVFEQESFSLGAGINKRINAFAYDINQIIYSTYDIVNGAKIFLCKSNNVPGDDDDYLNYSINAHENGYTVNFKAKPYCPDLYPDFLSVVYKYLDKISLYEIAHIFPDSKISVCINNYTNSIRKITIETKYSDSNAILDKRTISLIDGENQIFIPLKELRSDALKQVSEICFVLSPTAYIEDEGMFQIRDFKIVGI